MDIQSRILQSLRPRRDGVLLRADVKGFGSASQVSTALKALRDKGLIVQVHRGVYAKPSQVAQSGSQALVALGTARLEGLRQKQRVAARAARASTAHRVELLAKRKGVAFTPTFADRWANAATRMAGDEVASDATDDLLVALRRAGALSPREMTALVMAHHRERQRV